MIETKIKDIRLLMTKEQFYKLAVTHPEITAPSVFKLTIRQYDKDTKRYRKGRGQNDFYFKIWESSNLYTSKERAFSALIDFIKCSDDLNRSRVHSAVIERKPVDIPFIEGGILQWWLYDNQGNEIDKSVCSIEGGNELELKDVYFGRPKDEIRFKEGDIVEIVCGDKIFPAILNGVPACVDEMWKSHEYYIKNHGPVPDGKYPYGWYHDCVFRDTYFYLESEGFYPDTFPDNVFKPTFEVPREMVEELKERYIRWKESLERS